MSKVSDAKQAQGYTRETPCCARCRDFTCDKKESYPGSKYFVDTNMRCTVGQFKVHKMGWCNRYVAK